MDTTSQMPMGSTTNLPLDPGTIMAAMPSGPGAGAPPPMPPAAMGAMPTPGAPAGMPQPQAPAGPPAPPFDVEVQANGTIVSSISKGLPTGMKPIIIAVHNAPKIPPSLQALTQGAQGAPA